jgi:anion-transporting  ArsA/GET3 family ATPase
MGTPLLERTLLYVTGKGGVGKTTVAAALGLAAAARGRRTIVCEVAEQDRVSRAFAREGVRAEREVRLAENLWAITIDPTEALREWLARQLGGPALRLVTGSSAFQHFVAAAPGAKELITIAKVWELAQLERWDARNRSYDLVVVDAPASGHGVAMLTAPHTFGEIARVGPVRRQAFKVRDMLSDPARTGYVAVALPEEMPVNETLELGRRLEDAVDLGLDAIVMNGLYPERFTAREADALRAVAANGLAPDALAAVRAALTEHERARTQRTHLRRLKREAGAPVFTLPFLFEAEVGLEEYRTLAAKLGRDLERAGRGRASRPGARPGPARAT